MADLQKTEQILRALANGNRLRILHEIKQKKSLTVSLAARILGITVAAASRHLMIMEEAGILTKKKSGLFVTYRLDLSAGSWVRKIV